MPKLRTEQLVLSTDEYHALTAQRMPERAFQAHLLAVLNGLGYRVRHERTTATCPRCHGPSRCARGCRDARGRFLPGIAQGSDPGWPDLTIGLEDPPVLMIPELKTMRGKTTPDQDAWRRILQANGVYSEIWRPDQAGAITELLVARRNDELLKG